MTEIDKHRCVVIFFHAGTLPHIFPSRFHAIGVRREVLEEQQKSLTHSISLPIPKRGLPVCHIQMCTFKAMKILGQKFLENQVKTFGKTSDVHRYGPRLFSCAPPLHN
jgi:hypothetical protein